MADPRGFITTPRVVAERRPVAERVHDWKEVYPGTPGRALLPIITEQAGRCMDCGIPFCHVGCPLGNLIPEWNDLVWRSDWDEALERLVDPLVELLEAVLAPGGVCLIADPDRLSARPFRWKLLQAGYDATADFARAGEPGGERTKGTIYRVRRSKAAARRGRS